MTDARRGRGKGNGSGENWENSPFWENVPERKTTECRHNKMVWAAGGKRCKECGQFLN